MSKPNIIMILSDDQGAWAMGCAGNSELRTPNLDRLAASGVYFENFFCTSPVCSPARASIATGRMPSAHGIHDWLRAGDTIGPYETDGNFAAGKARVAAPAAADIGAEATDGVPGSGADAAGKPSSGAAAAAVGEQIEYLAGQPGFTDYLAASGYTCALSGKWHLGACHSPQKSYSFWRVHAKGGGPYYGAPMVDGPAVREEPRYITDVFTDNALEFLETQRNAKEPFCLGVHYTAPHSPWEREEHPKETWDDYLKNCPFESVPVEGRHPWATNAIWPTSAQHRRETLSGYFAAITEMDRNIGRILDWLEAEGKLKDTLIVFTSDNGMSMGHHGLYGKGNASFPMNMYDSAVKVPALLSWPGRAIPGTRCQAMLSHYDLFPTILDAAGIPNPQAASLPGASILPLLAGTTDRAGELREDVYIQNEYGPVRMVRTKEWKYVHRYPYGPHELYDLANDPDERFNLAAAADQAERVRGMRDKLETWFSRYADPARDGRVEPVTGLGQVDLAGPAAQGRRNFMPRP